MNSKKESSFLVSVSDLKMVLLFKKYTAVLYRIVVVLCDSM